MSLRASAGPSMSSVIDPSTLSTGWCVPSLIDLTLEGVSNSLMKVPLKELESLPIELIISLHQTMSRKGEWSLENLEYILSTTLFEQVDELLLTQCDSLRSETFQHLCSKLTLPLQGIDLSRSYQLTDCTPLLRLDLSECRTLDLDRCRRLTDSQVIPLLQACPNLERLRLSGTQIKDATIRALTILEGDGLYKAQCPHLTEVDLSCLVSDGLSNLCQSGLHLKDLRLSGTNFPTIQFDSLVLFADSLTSLNLSFVPRVRNETLLAIGRCHRLTSLDLSRNSNLNDDGFIHLQDLIYLRTLNLSRTGVSEVSLTTLQNFTRLTSLDLSYNEDVKDDLMVELCQSLTLLRVLILSCTCISDVTMLDGIIPCLKHLQVLKLNLCKKVGVSSFEGLWKKIVEQRGDGGGGKMMESIVHQRLSEVDRQDDPLPLSLEQSLRHSEPKFPFPFSLLTLDVGSVSMTDEATQYIGEVIYGITTLQRFGIWGSNINNARMKRNLAEWTERHAPCMVTTATTTTTTTTSAVSSSDANVSSSSSSSSFSWSPRPPVDLDSEPSYWYLDESMNTQPGTFLFVRRTTDVRATSAGQVILKPSHVGLGYMYGLEAYLQAAEEAMHQKRSNKSVRFDEECMVEFITPSEKEYEEDDGDTLETDGDGNAIDDGDDSDGEQESSVIRIDD